MAAGVSQATHGTVLFNKTKTADLRRMGVALTFGLTRGCVRSNGASGCWPKARPDLSVLKPPNTEPVDQRRSRGSVHRGAEERVLESHT